jgi:hypothetical protein
VRGGSRDMGADLEEAGELGDLEGGGGEEDLRHEGDGGAAADVRAAALVDAEARRLGQGADAAAVEVLEHQLQRLVADLHLLAEQLPELDLVLVLPLAGARGAAREEVAQEGAARAEHAAVHADVRRAGNRDARVGEEGEVVGGAERGGEVVGEAAERLQVGVRRVGAVDGEAVGVGERESGDLAVHGLHWLGAARRSPGWWEAARKSKRAEAGREEGARGWGRVYGISKRRD